MAVMQSTFNNKDFAAVSESLIFFQWSNGHTFLQLILSYNPPNMVAIAEKKVPKIQLIAGIIVGLIFLALVIFFIASSPDGHEQFRKRKAHRLNIKRMLLPL